MKQYECKKVENCFGGAHIYEYRVGRKFTEDLINLFSTIGSLKFHKNFPRPFFQVTRSDGTTIKGVLGDTVIKVSFPVTEPQLSKQDFEKFLNELLDGER